MKKLITIFLLLAISVYAFGQAATSKNPQYTYPTYHYGGLNVGAKTDANKFTITKIIKTGNKTSLYSGSTLLSIVNPDSLSYRTFGLYKADSNYQKPGAYTTRFDFKNEPAKEYLYRAYTGFGSTIKLYPLCNPTFSSQLQMTDARTMLVLAYTPDSIVITGFKFSLYTSGAYTGDQYNGIALYSFSNGVITQVSGGKTANDLTLWTATANTIATKALPAPITIPPGYYYIAFIYNSSAQTTAPIIYANSIGPLMNIGNGWTNNSSIAVACQINTQTDLTTPITLQGTVTGTANFVTGIIAY